MFDSADPPDPDRVYLNYLETCRLLGIEPVPRERALGLIQRSGARYCRGARNRRHTSRRARRSRLLVRSTRSHIGTRHNAWQKG